MNSMKNKEGSLKDFYKRVPASFYERMAFVLLLLIIGNHIVSLCIKLVFGRRIYVHLFGVVGTIAIIFTVFYVGSLLVQNNIKHMLKKMKIWDLALVAMFLWSVVSALLADDKDISIYGTGKGNEGVLTYAMYASYFICVKILKNKRQRKCILWGIGLMISIMAIVSVAQAVVGHSCGFVTYASTLSNINHFAYLLCMAVLIFASFVFEEEKNVIKAIALFLSGFNMWALIMNTTMGGYVGAWFGLVFLVVIMLIHDKNKWKEAVLVVSVILLINVVMNLNNGMIAENIYISMDGITEEGLTDAAGSGRIALWKHAFGCIVKRPIFGYGPEGFYTMAMNGEVFEAKPHNEYIQHAAFIGIPGLVFYLVALCSLFVFCVKRLKEPGYMVLTLGATLFAYCVSAFFGNTLFETAPYYFIVLGLLSASCCEQENVTVHSKL